MSRYYTSTRFRPECPTCGNKIGQLEESYKRLLEQGKTPHDALDSLNIVKPCCRVRALWPVVLPIGAFYLPHHEAAMQNYLGFKPEAPQPNLVVLSLRKAANGEHFIVSHVDERGFIGSAGAASAGGLMDSHEPTEVVIRSSGEDRRIVIKEPGQLSKECEVRVQTEPGEITRGFPYETRAFRRDIQVDKVRSYFDLAPVEEQVVADAAPAVRLEDLMLPPDEEDEPLIA